MLSVTTVMKFSTVCGIRDDDRSRPDPWWYIEKYVIDSGQYWYLRLFVVHSRYSSDLIFDDVVDWLMRLMQSWLCSIHFDPSLSTMHSVVVVSLVTTDDLSHCWSLICWPVVVVMTLFSHSLMAFSINYYCVCSHLTLIVIYSVPFSIQYSIWNDTLRWCIVSTIQYSCVVH